MYLPRLSLTRLIDARFSIFDFRFSLPTLFGCRADARSGPCAAKSHSCNDRSHRIRTTVVCPRCFDSPNPTPTPASGIELCQQHQLTVVIPLLKLINYTLSKQASPKSPPWPWKTSMKLEIWDTILALRQGGGTASILLISKNSFPLSRLSRTVL